MNLHQMNVFVTVVDAGTFSAAAEELGIAQPAVSTAIQRLERALGGDLFDRVGRGISLTRDGAAFLPHARAILAEVAASRRELRTVRGQDVASVTLGVPPMVAGYLLPPIIERFLAARPTVRVVLVQAGADDVAERVLRGALDLGIVAEWQIPAGLTTVLLHAHPIVACVSDEHRLAGRKSISWAQLLREPLIAFPKGYHQRRRLEEAAAQVGFQPNIVVESESVPLIIDLVRRGHGVATLLAAAARGWHGVHRLSLPSDGLVPIAVCRRIGAPASAVAKHLEDCLADGLSRHSAQAVH